MSGGGTAAQIVVNKIGSGNLDYRALKRTPDVTCALNLIWPNCSPVSPITGTLSDQKRQRAIADTLLAAASTYDVRLAGVFITPDESDVGVGAAAYETGLLQSYNSFSSD